MKSKTARRFLDRNRNKILRHETGIDKQIPSFLKRYKQAVKDVEKK